MSKTVKSIKQFYILREQNNLDRCKAFLDNLFQYANGKLYQVQIVEYKKNRSLAQNRLYWLFLNTLSPHTGFTKDELHERFAVKFLGVEEKEVEGQILRRPISTTSLDTKQFTEYLEKIELVAVELGIILPYPDDIKYAMEGR